MDCTVILKFCICGPFVPGNPNCYTQLRIVHMDTKDLESVKSILMKRLMWAQGKFSGDENDFQCDEEFLQCHLSKIANYCRILSETNREFCEYSVCANDAHKQCQENKFLRSIAFPENNNWAERLVELIDSL